MSSNHNNESLISFLDRHADSNSVSFHMPGHKGSKFYRNLGYGDLLDKLVDMDVTEIPGGDNLFQPETVIRNIMDRYRELYGAGETFLSVGGSSAGLIASILATVGEGDPVIMARNCHKSVYNGVRLACGEPIYVYPEELRDYGIAGAIKTEDMEKALMEWEKKCSDSSGPVVIITSPNYYGICSDVAGIAKLVHEKDGILIVDQAHGAHLKFMRGMMKGVESAEECGADIVVNSIHKTLASFTQTAILNLCSDKVQPEVLGDRLQMIETSSPSYILMASMDICAEILEEKGEELIRCWESNLSWFYKEVSQIGNVKILAHPRQDQTKIVFKKEGMSGYELERCLNDRGIIPELSDSDWVMAMTGIGNTPEDYERLLEALKS